MTGCKLGSDTGNRESGFSYSFVSVSLTQCIPPRLRQNTVSRASTRNHGINIQTFCNFEMQSKMINILHKSRKMVHILRQERILSFEGGSSRSHYVEEPFWRRLWTCRQTEYWMDEINFLIQSLCTDVIGSVREKRVEASRGGSFVARVVPSMKMAACWHSGCQMNLCSFLVLIISLLFSFLSFLSFFLSFLLSFLFFSFSRTV